MFKLNFHFHCHKNQTVFVTIKNASTSPIELRSRIKKGFLGFRALKESFRREKRALADAATAACFCRSAAAFRYTLFSI
jgi:hypothetical protein